MKRNVYIIFAFIYFTHTCYSQQVTDTINNKWVAANPTFINKGKGYQKLWGHNRRVEWATLIRVPYLWLDSVYGGLRPYEQGGGNETKSLRLTNAEGKEYTLRSINKSRDDVVEERFKKSFVEDLIKDGVSSSYPYGALTVTQMQEAVGIYHAIPVLVYLPHQPVLGSFDTQFGDDLYIFEQRPDGDWSQSANMGNFNDFSSTVNVIKKIQEDNKNIADQQAFIKARLFDMLITDWDRHEDNWRWGKKKQNGGTIYIPVPRDRDQAFYTHDGILLDKALSAAGLGFMQNFDSVPGSMPTLNIEEKDIDRFFTNGLSWSDWDYQAKYLQETLTDTVIAESVRDLPPEIFAVSGNELIAKLQARRSHLQDIARSYYLFIAKETEVAGSSKREFFEINSEDSGKVILNIYRYDKAGLREHTPFYHRVFVPSETQELRVFGINGEDVYKIDIHSSPIKVRIIGGPGKDSIIQSGERVHVYDNRNNIFQTSSSRLHLSSDSSIHVYNYESYQYDSKGFSPLFNYDYEDRIYVGLEYSCKNHRWRKDPFASRHSVSLKYSFSQDAISVGYKALFPQVIGNPKAFGWGLFLQANFDAIRWTNFYGLGNETEADTKNKDYYRMISRNWLLAAGLRRTMQKHTLEAGGFFEQVNIRTDTGHYVAKIVEPGYPGVFSPNDYAGLRISYSYLSLNDATVPTKGFTFLANAMLANNFQQEEFFQHYSFRGQGYLPLSKKFSIMMRAGGETVFGEPAKFNNAQLLQHAVIGGPENFRGYRLERFWGKSAFYNNNELRFITQIRTYPLNATAGIFGFFDNGRVWQYGEDSDIWHTTYGGGILFAPFHAMAFTITYGVSKNENLVQFRFNTIF